MVVLTSAPVPVAGSQPAGFQSSNPNCTVMSPYECGWWWKMRPPEKQGPLPAPSRQPARPSEKLVEIDCTDPDQWQPPCGFVNPGNNYAFQSQQRDALMRYMVMRPNSPSAVRGFQRYNQWVFDRAIAIGRMWRWNMVQDPSLNPLKATPVSQFGMRLLLQQEAHQRTWIYQSLGDEGAFFVYFSRTDCDYCHAMQPIIERLAEKTNLAVYDASLDSRCMPGFSHDRCMTAPQTIRPARILNVRTVPALFLHLPDDNQWVRLSSGVAALSKLESRIRLFVAAIKAANANAIVNASESPNGRPSVAFQRRDQIQALARYGLGRGVSVPKARQE